jgi:hypothetical protein
MRGFPDGRSAPAPVFRAEPTEFADAQTDLTARGQHMDTFVRACLRRLHRDLNGLLALLAQAWPDPASRAMAKLWRLAGLLGLPLLAVCGFLAGLGVTHLAQAEHGSNFTSTPQFKTWSALAGALMAIAFVIFFYSVGILRELHSRFPHEASWKRLLGSYVVFSLLAFLVTIIFGHPDMSAVAEYAAPRIIFLVLGLVASGPSVMGIWVIYWGLRRMKDQIVKAGNDQKASSAPTDAVQATKRQILSDLLVSRTKLLALLSAVGALIGVSVLTTGALRNALLSVKPASGKMVDYPIEYVLINGLFYSALLAVIYIPAYFRLQDRSREYIQMVFPVPDEGHYSGDEHTERDNLGKLLQVDASVGETLQTGLAIIAPLMATLLSVLLPAPKLWVPSWPFFIGAGPAIRHAHIVR